MISRDLHYEGRLSEKADAEGPVAEASISLVAIWMVLSLLVLIAAGLFYAEAHGLFRASTALPASSWPDGLP